jgi:hypothetical protein
MVDYVYDGILESGHPKENLGITRTAADSRHIQISAHQVK